MSPLLGNGFTTHPGTQAILGTSLVLNPCQQVMTILLPQYYLDLSLPPSLCGPYTFRPHTSFCPHPSASNSSSILSKMLLLNCSSAHTTLRTSSICSCRPPPILLLALRVDLSGPQQWPPWILVSVGFNQWGALAGGHKGRTVRLGSSHPGSLTVESSQPKATAPCKVTFA